MNVGAGISTAANIPDFRSPKTGIYDNLKEYKLPKPESIFDLRFFNQNPKPFFQFFQTLVNFNAKPTATHRLLATLVQMGIVKRIYSQNIDDLETMAGIDRKYLVWFFQSLFMIANDPNCICLFAFRFKFMEVFVTEAHVQNVEKSTATKHCFAS